jgi:hypothetical protein
MRRSMSSACLAFLFVLAGALTLVAPAASAEPSPAVYVVAQPTDTLVPTNAGPDLNPPQQPSTALAAETKKKLWIGGIAVALFALVYWRNKRRWNKWRKARKAAG